MKRMHFFILLAAIVVTQSCGQQASSTVSTANNSSSTTVKGQSAVHDDDSQKNILQIAIGSQDHTTLTAAVQAAQLEDVLSNAGSLTVFAPNNAAFAKLPAGTVDNLLKPENKSTLARIIKHHAAPGSFKAENLKNNQQLYQATGQYIKVERKDDGVYVGGAKILGSVQASNGIVHIVDSVILPAEN